MEANNPLYKNQGMHMVSAIFTIDKGITKVLLIKRKNEPYKDMWALVGGALYNNETLDAGMRREIQEKTGINDIQLFQCNVYDELHKYPVMRMVAILYIGLIDKGKAEILNSTLKTSNADWFRIEHIPLLAYDHNELLKESLEHLKLKIIKSDILKVLFPLGFTIPEIQKVYETILNKKFDRRNFRRKLLSLNLIEDTNIDTKFEGNKPAKLYDFKKNIDDKNVF